jgi:hypothetical protein
MPNNGYCVSVYLCAALHIVNDGSDSGYSLVGRNGDAPNDDYLLLFRSRGRLQADYRSFRLCMLAA